MGNDMIGGAVPIGASIVTSVVARPAGLVLVPLLGYRDPTEHCMLDVMGIHLLQQLGHAVGFLVEIDVMQMGVGVLIVACLGVQHRQRSEQAQGGTAWGLAGTPL